MIATFELDGTPVEMKCTAATPYRFKKVFPGKDILKTLASEKEIMENGTDHTMRLMYIMAMQAAGADMEKLNEETYMEWLDKYSMGTIIDNTDVALDLFQSTEGTTSTPKK